jgi:hypothetical protein
MLRPKPSPAHQMIMKNKLQMAALSALVLTLFTACASWEIHRNEAPLMFFDMKCDSSGILWQVYAEDRTEDCNVEVKTGIPGVESCEATLRLTDFRGRTSTTNSPAPGQWIALNGIKKLELLCSPSFELTNGCTATVRTITQASASDTVTNITRTGGYLAVNDLHCSQRAVIFPTGSFTNIPSNVTILWRGATNCDAKITVVYDGGRTRQYQHGEGTKWKMATFIKVARLEAFCEGTVSSPHEPCSFHLLQVERKK